MPNNSKSRKRRQADGSKSGTSSSDNSFGPSASTPTTKVVKKKQKTVESDDGAVLPTSTQQTLSKFEFVPRSNMADNSDTGSVQASNGDAEVFSSESTRGVSNEDLMKKLCTNGSDIAKLFDSFEHLRSDLLALQLENDRLRKEVKEAKEREDKLHSKLEEVKRTADLADSRSEELACYVRRNNIRIFGVDETTGRDGRDETPAECEKKVLQLFREKLKVKVELADIEAVHRLGGKKPASRPGPSTQQQQRQPRGIIVRFVSRRVRDSVLYARRELRGTRKLIVEDLTPRAYSLLCKVRDDTAVCQQAWTKRGIVQMKTVNGRIVTVQSLRDLTEHRQACNANVQSAGQK